MRNRVIGGGLALVLVMAGCGADGELSGEIDPTLPEGVTFGVTYDGKGCTLVGPSEVETGEHSFLLGDQTGELEALYMMRLDPDKTLQDAMDDQPAPGRWHSKPAWMHYTVDVERSSSDDGEVFVIRLDAAGEHVGLASRYYGAQEERVHWYCSPTFMVLQDSG